MTDNVTRLPEPGVILDLDTVERPASEVKPPFVVNVGERKIKMEDPSEIDWRDLATVEIPADLLRVAMSNDDRVYLTGQALPAWKFNRLMEAYYTHYDLEDKIREAKRQAQFAGL
jgi:hypothetical protein